ncbi:hypothetical protein BVRB_042210, partial [Beta vulgaris subsp. vulgaris]
KTIKGVGLQDLDLQQTATTSTDPNLEAVQEHEDPARRLWAEFVERTRDLHEHQCRRLEEMMAQRSTSANRIRLLVQEMKAASRSDWLRKAGDKIIEMRAMVTRWSDTEATSLTDLDTFL